MRQIDVDEYKDFSAKRRPRGISRRHHRLLAHHPRLLEYRFCRRSDLNAVGIYDRPDRAVGKCAVRRFGAVSFLFSVGDGRRNRVGRFKRVPGESSLSADEFRNESVLS